MPSADDLKYLQMSPQDLDLTIGASLLDDSFGAKPTTDTEKRSAAAAWFAANLGRFRQGVCGNHLIREDMFGNDKQDRNLLFGTVIDTLAKLGGFPVPVAVIAAKLIYYGLDHLCMDVKEPGK
jgi:hypothetical protein